MKNKILSFIICLIFLNFGVTLINAKDNQKVIVGLDINVPPMGFLDSTGEIVGLDIDLAKATFKSIGKEVIFQPIDWDSKELELNTNKIDVIWNGMSYTPERAENMLVTKAYMQNNQVFIVKSDSNIFNLNDLNNKIICVQKGSTGATSLKNSDISQNVKSIIELENMVNCLNEIKLSKSDATVVDEVTARYYLNKNNLESEFKILDEPLSTENYVIAVKKGNENLKQQIENGLSQIINSGEAKKISEKWFGKNVICFETIQKNDTECENKNYNFLIELSKGLLETLKLFIICLTLSIPLGIILSFIRNSKVQLLKLSIDLYIGIMRGTPLLLQIFFMFYGLPIIFPKLQINDRFLIGIIAFVLNYAAYFTEIFRGGIKSINKGQFEAIKILKIPKMKAIFKILLPQIFKVCLPSVCNESISLVKDTALIFSIGIVELLTTAKNIVNSTANITAYIIVFGIYLIICSLISIFSKFLENKLKFE